MTTLDSRAERIRRFNRFYTERIGVLREGLLDSPFSLAEARVIYEIANSRRASAAAIGKRLALDPGYLSRIVQRLMRSGILTRARSERDGRERILSLTTNGRAQFATLNRRSHQQAVRMLGALPEAQQCALVQALDSARTILDPPADRGLPFSDSNHRGADASRRANKLALPYTLRPQGPGDMGWVVEAHGEIYCRDYGWHPRFEALVARITADFIDHFDPERERCWIGEIPTPQGPRRAGSIFLVRKSATVAQLRLLLVLPEARGLGLGSRLVHECIGFARKAGYRQIVLWTNSILHAARHIYEKAGFELIKEETGNDYGPEMTFQTWRLKL